MYDNNLIFKTLITSWFIEWTISVVYFLEFVCILEHIAVKLNWDFSQRIGKGAQNHLNTVHKYVNLMENKKEVTVVKCLVKICSIKHRKLRLCKYIQE